MKYFIFILVSITVSSECVVALKFINPVVSVAKDKFGYSWDELKVKCDSKDVSFFPEIENLRDQYDLKSAGVKDEVLIEANKSRPTTDKKWNKLISQNCFPNHDLTSVSQDAIDKIQLCLNKQNQLSEKETVNAKRELLERFCSIIKTWSKFEYMNQ
ncbi:uncharacterized protein LOC117170765 [Belonocnema kinseyi]|uniref:uncharacterized protein LOC117170765 n=1 Tax=Belonocnema kinseyi TaxID=2817044 RepID=UPI00143D3E60|nr:uncharacterized protein LOC117170765 [Belonocnema kinseyi]